MFPGSSNKRLTLTYSDWPRLGKVFTWKLIAVTKSCDILIVQTCITGAGFSLNEPASIQMGLQRKMGCCYQKRRLGCSGAGVPDSCYNVCVCFKDLYVCVCICIFILYLCNFIIQLFLISYSYECENEFWGLYTYI